MDLSAFAADVGRDGPVTVTGLGTRGGPVPGVRVVRPPVGIEWIEVDEMTVCCGAGTPVDDLTAALAEHGQRTVLPPGGTVGGALSVGRSGIRRLGDGPVRDALLQARYVGADGEVVKAGGPTVKNVSGFDVCRLLVGSRGTLGFLGEVILRTRPVASHSQWFRASTADPMRVFGSVHRPVSVLWDGLAVHVLLEGHPADVAEQAAAASLAVSDGPPPVPNGRFRVDPRRAVAAAGELEPGSFVVELGLGTVHVAVEAVPEYATDRATDRTTDRATDRTTDRGVAAVEARVKARFDPADRLNPGRGPQSHAR